MRSVNAMNPSMTLEYLARSRPAPEEELERMADLWAARLAEVPTVLEIPSDKTRPYRYDLPGERLPVVLSTETTKSIFERSWTLNVTPFSFLLATFGLTLSRLTGARTLLLGVPLLNHYVSNLIPVRIDIDDDLAPQAFVRNVHDSLLWSLDAGDIPFEQIVARLGVRRSGPSHPLVQVSFGMHDPLIPARIETDTAAIRRERNGGGSQFDIAVQFSRSVPSLAGYAEYATSLWSRGEAQSFVMDYVAAAEQLSEATAVNGTDRALADVRCISAAGR